MANINFFVSIYIDIFPCNKKSRHRRQFFLVSGRRVNLPAPPLPPPLIFTSAAFSVSGTEVQWSDIWTNDIRCSDSDMRAMSAVNRMARWWAAEQGGPRQSINLRNYFEINNNLSTQRKCWKLAKSKQNPILFNVINNTHHLSIVVPKIAIQSDSLVSKHECSWIIRDGMGK